MPASADSESSYLVGSPDCFRYRVQVCFPETGEEEEWETINSFSTPREALRGSSQCYDTVRDLLDIEFCQELEPGFVKIRILDAREDRVILWENETGGLVETGDAFRPDERPTGQD